MPFNIEHTNDDGEHMKQLKDLEREARELRVKHEKAKGRYAALESERQHLGTSSSVTRNQSHRTKSHHVDGVSAPALVVSQPVTHNDRRRQVEREMQVLQLQIEQSRERLNEISLQKMRLGPAIAREMIASAIAAIIAIFEEEIFCHLITLKEACIIYANSVADLAGEFSDQHQEMHSGHLLVAQFLNSLPALFRPLSFYTGQIDENASEFADEVLDVILSRK